MADQCFVFLLEVGNKRRKWKACAFVFVWPKGRWELRCRCLHKALLVLWALLPALFAEAPVELILGFSGGDGAGPVLEPPRDLHAEFPS